MIQFLFAKGDTLIGLPTFLQLFRHKAQGGEGAALRVGTAVDKKCFHISFIQKTMQKYNFS